MQKTLLEYHFDPKKSGEILKRWVKDAGMSYAEVADQTGYSQDTINNSLSGKIKELSLERVFKIAVLTGHSVCEYLREMLDGADIAFADRIHVLTDKPLHMVKYTDTIAPSLPAVLPEHHTDDATLDRFRRIHGDYAAAIREQTKQQLDTMERQHREHNSTVEKLHAAHLDDLYKNHAEVVAKLELENKRLRKRNIFLTIALALETIAVIGITMYDMLNRNVGWFRGLFSPGGAGNGFDSLRG